MEIDATLCMKFQSYTFSNVYVTFFERENESEYARSICSTVVNIEFYQKRSYNIELEQNAHPLWKIHDNIKIE